MQQETIQEFLERGGKIKVIDNSKVNYFAEMERYSKKCRTNNLSGDNKRNDYYARQRLLDDIGINFNVGPNYLTNKT